MDLDSLLHHTFGTDAIETLSPDALALGIERLGTAFGVEREPGRRFAIWALLHALGEAPDPETAFKDPAERRAALDYAWAAGKAADRE